MRSIARMYRFVTAPLPTRIPDRTSSRLAAHSDNQGICLDRLLKQRSALRKPDFSFDFPPLRGGLGSLSVAADCIASESRALSELLS